MDPHHPARIEMQPTASRTTSPADTPRRILVWDAPLRVFHWLLVACFAGAWLSAEAERWRWLHVMLGYTFGALLLFRLLWGIVGPRHARFASFVRGPAAVLRYLRSLAGGRPEHHVGHNPAGALAIVALLALGLGVSASGLALQQDLGGRWVEELHEALASGMLALVVLHVAAVLVASRLHHENLVGAMLTGRKIGRPRDAIVSAWRSVAVLLIAAVLGFWWLQWRQAPVGDAPGATAAAGHRDRAARDHDDD